LEKRLSEMVQTHNTEGWARSPWSLLWLHSSIHLWWCSETKYSFYFSKLHGASQLHTSRKNL